MIGANVKKIMPDDVAEKHDGYLHRYKATGVKTVIGIKRCGKGHASVAHHAVGSFLM
jgi:hypothetical protein